MSIFELFRKILINYGQHGTKQMCAGFLHEVEIPEELKDETNY